MISHIFLIKVLNLIIFLNFNSHDSRRKGEAIEEHIKIFAVKNSVAAVDLECLLARPV